MDYFRIKNTPRWILTSQNESFRFNGNDSRNFIVELCRLLTLDSANGLDSITRQENEDECGDDEGDPWELLRSHPAFLRMCLTLEEANPISMMQLTEEIARNNQRLFALTSASRDRFCQMIFEERAKGRLVISIGGGQGTSVSYLTSFELEAVGRLKDLFGLPIHDVIRAYITCNKNEVQAAEFLVEEMEKN